MPTPLQVIAQARTRFSKEVRYYLAMMRDEEYPSHALGHIETACARFGGLIERQLRRAEKAQEPKCRHKHRAGPFHTEGKARVWYRCDDCGRYGSRYHGEKRLSWGYLKAGEVRPFYHGLPYSEFE